MIDRYLIVIYCLQETAKLIFCLLLAACLFMYIKDQIKQKKDDPENEDDDLGI